MGRKPPSVFPFPSFPVARDYLGDIFFFLFRICVIHGRYVHAASTAQPGLIPWSRGPPFSWGTAAWKGVAGRGAGSDPAAWGLQSELPPDAHGPGSLTTPCTPQERRGLHPRRQRTGQYQGSWAGAQVRSLLWSITASAEGQSPSPGSYSHQPRFLPEASSSGSGVWARVMKEVQSWKKLR